MFQITQYLQYRNTPNGKPRVIVEGVDYYHKTNNSLWQFQGYSNTPDFEGHLLLKVANIADCRPLLEIQLKNYRFTRCISDKVLNLRELQIVHYKGKKAESEDDYDRKECWGISVFRDCEMCVFFPHPQVTWAVFSKHIKNKNLLEYTGINTGVLNYDDMSERFEFFNFEDNPKTYSKLLWNCSEEEGWKKIFKLLEIK